MNSTRLLLAFLICAAAQVSTIAEPTNLARKNLLEYQGSDGNTHQASTPADWRKRRAEILQGMQSVMGDYPDHARRAALNVQVEHEQDAGSYVRRLITYQSDVGSRTPAYLCIPKSVLAANTKAPAVLCLHPTDNTVGHKVVVGLGGLAGRQYAAELAELGYVTLAPSYPHLANYWPNLGKLGYQSGTMKAIWDNSRGLDLLAEMSEVDTSRGFGVIGHSLGGHNAIFTAAFDNRIAVLAVSCSFDSFQDYYSGNRSNWFFGKGWCQIRYMPRLSNYRDTLDEIPFDFHELIGTLAPRPMFVNAPLHDSNFQADSVDRCIAAARPVYRLFGAENNLFVRHPNCEHDFPESMRVEAYETINSVLRMRDRNQPED